jgi:hypothetical protein
MTVEWRKEFVRIRTGLRAQNSPLTKAPHNETLDLNQNSTEIIKLIPNQFSAQPSGTGKTSKVTGEQPCVMTPQQPTRDPTTQCLKLDQAVDRFLQLPENQWLRQTTPVPFEEWVARFKASRQVELAHARAQVAEEGIAPKDAKLKSFIKIEPSTTATDPRNISPRSERFLSILGPYVASIEKLAKECPYLVKGLTPQVRGPLMAEHWRGAIVETDFSRFDMTVSRDMIIHVERALFRKAYPEGLYPDLDLILPMLEKLTGLTDLGVSYTVDGTRASGDAHTSIANGFLNRFIIWYCLRNHDSRSWSSFHEGDDGFINCETDAVEEIVNNLNCASILGFKLKVEIPATPELANFCGRSICSDCHREFCDLPRAFSKLHVTVKQGDLKALALAKAYSYLSTDPHTPMISVLCGALIAHLEPIVSYRKLGNIIKHTRRYEVDKILKGKKDVDRNLQISPCCRAAVALQTGWSPQLQVAFEDEVREWKSGVTWISPIAVDDYQVDSEKAIFY